MKRALFALLLVVPFVGGAWPSAAQEPADGVERVVVISMPGLRWADLEGRDLPAFERLLHASAVAQLSVRTLGPTTSLSEGYATIGAGNRAGAPARIGGLALDADEPFENGTAGEAFARRCGCRAGDAAVVHLDMAQVRAYNDRLLYGSEVGLLGDALRRAGLTTAVIANADTALEPDDDERHREATLTIADLRGRVDTGTVDADLVQEEPTAPFGLRLAIDAVDLPDADVTMVEASDLARLEHLRPLATAEAIEAAKDRVLTWTDRLLDHVLAQVDLERDLVVLVAPTSPAALGSSKPQAELTVAAVAGPGFEPGKARSATTRRAGYVTLPDIAPTILDVFGLDAPDEMTGTPITSDGGDAPTAGTIAVLADDNELTVFRDKATGPVSVAFIVFQVLVYFAAIAALWRFPTWRRVLRPLALVTLAQPTLVYLSKLVGYDDLGIGGYTLALFAGGAVLAVVAELVGRRTRTSAPLLLIGLLLLVLVVDVLVGAPLQIDTVFGYSPTVAGRFSGYGNLAFGMVAACAVLLATGLWSWTRRLGPPVALLLAVVVVDGFPAWGADVGGVLALVPTTIVIALLLSGRSVDWRKAASIAAVTVVVLGGFAAADLLRPEDSRTHLGRLAERVVGGDGGLATVVQRKLETNLSILTSSVWTWLIPVAVVFLAFLLWRRAGWLRRLEGEAPGLRAGLVGLLVAGGLGFALNDSGVAVPAVMLAIVLPYLTYLVLAAGDEAAP